MPIQQLQKGVVIHSETKTLAELFSCTNRMRKKVLGENGGDVGA